MAWQLRAKGFDILHIECAQEKMLKAGLQLTGSEMQGSVDVHA